MKNVFVIVAVAVVITACNNTRSNNSTEEGAEEVQTVAGVKPEDLLAREWKLTELNGSDVQLDTTFRSYPHLKFESLTRAGGNLGCNGFGANVDFIAADSITISEIVSTQMACPNLDIENGFRKALEDTRTFKVEGNTLSLKNDKSEVISKLTW